MTEPLPEEVYMVWLQRYSPDGDPGEALRNVRKELEKKQREDPPSLEVRVAALEQFNLIWTEFIISMLWTPELAGMGPDQVVRRSVLAIEFLQLAALDQAIELDRMAHGKEDK